MPHSQGLTCIAGLLVILRLLLFHCVFLPLDISEVPLTPSGNMGNNCLRHSAIHAAVDPHTTNQGEKIRTFSVSAELLQF